MIWKKNIIAGFNITTIGDDRNYSYIPTRYGNTLADKVSKHILQDIDYVEYSFLDRGSDERQYCSPGVGLPIATICRTKYGEYPEYHTSLDDLTLISSDGLKGGFDIIKKTIEILEFNQVYKNKTPCEPQLGKYDLYPTISIKGSKQRELSNLMLNILAYADGDNDILEISEIIRVDFFTVYNTMKILVDNELVILEWNLDRVIYS